MPACLRLLLCALACCFALRASALETSSVLTRTLGQTGTYQFEIEFRTEVEDLELFAPERFDLSAATSPLPSPPTRRLWLTTDNEGLRHIQFSLETNSPWIDAWCAPTPDALQGTVVPEPATLAFVFALATFVSVAVKRCQHRRAVQRV